MGPHAIVCAGLEFIAIIMLHHSECQDYRGEPPHQTAHMTHVKTRGQPLVLFLSHCQLLFISLCFWNRVFHWPGTHLWGQAGSPRNPQPLLPQIWNHKHTPPHLDFLFNVGSGAWTQFLHLRKQAFCFLRRPFFFVLPKQGQLCPRQRCWSLILKHRRNSSKAKAASSNCPQAQHLQSHGWLRRENHGKFEDSLGYLKQKRINLLRVPVHNLRGFCVFLFCRPF